MAFALTVVPSLPTGWQLQTRRLSLTASSLHRVKKKKEPSSIHSTPARFRGGFVFNYRDNIPFEERKVAYFSSSGLWLLIGCSTRNDYSGRKRLVQGLARGYFCVAFSCLVKTAGPFFKEITTYQFSLKFLIIYSLSHVNSALNPSTTLSGPWGTGVLVVEIGRKLSSQRCGALPCSGPVRGQTERGGFPDRIMKFSLGFL